MKRAGIKLVKDFEGCRLQAYRCPAGVPTIGWGRTTGVKMGDRCTQAQADAWLNAEYDAFEAGVAKLIGKARTTANMLGAMTCLAYNIGLAGFARSSVLKRHLAGDHANAARAFALWNKDGGKVLAGLVRRRLSEAALYLA